jgi:hypothetical protein
MFEPRRGEEVTGGWREAPSETLQNLYYPPNIITVIELRRMEWEGHKTRMGEIRDAYRILMVNLKER